MKKGPWISFGLFWAGFFILFWLITGGISDVGIFWSIYIIGPGALILICIGIIIFVSGLFKKRK